MLEGLLAAFQKVYYLLLAVIHIAALLDGAVGAVRLHHKHRLRIPQNGDVRVVRGKNKLPAALDRLDAGHDGVVDAAVVQIVLWLVDDEGTVAVKKKYWQYGVALLPRGQSFRWLVGPVVVQFDYRQVEQLRGMQLDKRLFVPSECGHNRLCLGRSHARGLLNRIDLHREGQGAVEAAINVGSTSQTGSVSIERCRFGLKGCDLKDANCTSAPAYGAAMYVQIGRPQVISIRHCVVNTVADGGYYMASASWGIYAQGAVFAVLDDIDVWSATAPYGGDAGMYGNSDAAIKLGYYNSSNGSYSTPCGNCNCGRIRVHYLRNGSNGYLPPAIYLYSTEFASLRNVSLSMESRALGSGTPSVVAPGGILVDSEGAPEFIYKDLSANLPEVWKVGRGCGVFKLCGSGASRLPGCAKEINGIAVTLGTTGGIDTQNNGNYYENYKSTDTSQWQQYAAVQLAISSQNNGTHEPVIARNITVTHPRGIALYASNCYMKGCTLQGMLRACSATCDIASLTSWCPGNAVGAASGSTVRIGTLALGRGNIAGTDSDPAVLGSPMESQSFVYVGSSNAQLMGDTRSTSTSYDNCYAVACGSEIDEGRLANIKELARFIGKDSSQIARGHTPDASLPRDHPPHRRQRHPRWSLPRETPRRRPRHVGRAGDGADGVRQVNEEAC